MYIHNAITYNLPGAVIGYAKPPRHIYHMRRRGVGLPPSPHCLVTAIMGIHRGVFAKKEKVFSRTLFFLKEQLFLKCEHIFNRYGSEPIPDKHRAPLSLRAP